MCRESEIRNCEINNSYFENHYNFYNFYKKVMGD